MRGLRVCLVILALGVLGGCEPPPAREVVVREEVVVERPASSAQTPGDFIPGPATSVATTAPVSQSPYYSTQEVAAYFYNDLAPYGRWINVADYGACWQPYDTPPGWRPYTLGYWALTDDYGWFWLSDEPFGWCCYHYGRWAFVAGYGWCWVPGEVWGAAWVVWRYGGGYCGWAPLFPGVEIGFEIAEPPPWCWVFVEERFLTDVRLREHIEPVTRNVTLINVTKNITRYETANGRLVNRGPEIRAIERAIGRPLPRFKVTEAPDPRSTGIRGNQIAVYRPRLPVRPPAARQPAEREPRNAVREPPAPRPQPPSALNRARVRRRWHERFRHFLNRRR